MVLLANFKNYRNEDCYLPVLFINPETNETVIKKIDTITHTLFPPSLYKN